MVGDRGELTARPGTRDRAWALSGAVAVVLFGCGLIFGDLLGSTNYPPLNAAAGRVHAYFTANADDVRLLAFCHTLSALALLAFAAYLYRWLRGRAPEGAHGAAALAGTAFAAAFLMLSAFCYRTLVEPSVLADVGLAHALVVLSYLTGGPAIALGLVPAIAAVTAISGGSDRPHWRSLRRLGVAAGVLCVASATTVLGPMDNSSAAYGILLLSAVLGFVWVFALSVSLTARSSP